LRRLEVKKPDEGRGCAYMDMAEDLVRWVVEGCWGWPEEGAGTVEGVVRGVGKMRPLGKKCLDKSRDPADVAKARRHPISGSVEPYGLHQRRAPP
jgi:hypothetical protein